MIENGYESCSSERCLYYRTHKDGEITLVLVYVDEILCATNIESVKADLFAKLHVSYGIKDRGVLSEYLGVQVKVDASKIKISQGVYAREILDKFGFSDAHAVGNPLETRQKL